MSALRDIDPDLQQRMAGRAKSANADVDVYAIAIAAQEMTDRKRGTSRPVLNPNGLFVQWVTKAIHECQQAKRLTRVQLSSELARYGEFYVQLYALCVLERPKPRDLAETLEMMRRSGYPHVSTYVIDRLRKLGEHWPGQAVEPHGALSKAGGQG